MVVSHQPRSGLAMYRLWRMVCDKPAVINRHQTRVSQVDLRAKVVKSAAANAENNYQMAPSDLRVVGVQIDQGATLKRIRAQARGRVSPILRHTSHITVVVDVEG